MSLEQVGDKSMLVLLSYSSMRWRFTPTSLESDSADDFGVNDILSQRYRKQAKLTCGFLVQCRCPDSPSRGQGSSWDKPRSTC